MNRLNSLFLVGGITVSADVNCAGIPPWEPKVYSDKGAKVVYDEALFEQAYWAGASDVPDREKQYGAWIFVDNCLDSTTPTSTPTKTSTTPASNTSSHASQSTHRVDCSDAFPYEAKAYQADNNQMKVYFEGNKYLLKFYAGADQPPKVSGGGDSYPWEYLGVCVGETMGDGPNTGINTPIDCTFISQWVGRKTYANEHGYNVSFEGKVYTNRYYTQAVPPTKTNNGDYPWSQIGKCIPGTEQEVPDTDLPANIAEMLCSCCMGCADIVTMSPVCMESAEGECYFTDCAKIGGYDEAKCAEVKKGGYLGDYTGAVNAPVNTWPSRVYAPYVDSGLYPFMKLSQVAAEVGVKHFVLAFLTAATGQTIEGCKAGFAGVIPITAGPTAWNTTTMTNDYLYDEVNKLREMGGDVMVSFGGAMGTELADAVACKQTPDPVASLVEAYSEAIDFLKLNEIDFDIEGGAVSSTNRATGWKLRFDAVKQLMKKYPNINVTWTLPILPTGLTMDGNQFVNDLLAAGLPLHRLNVMTMDYGDDTVCPGNEMGRCERDAVKNLAQQVYDAMVAQGAAANHKVSSVKDVYPFLGSTPMLGMNDIVTEMYTVADARNNLKEWQINSPLGFLSNWSLHRDRPCAANISYVDTMCSGSTDQTKPYDYANVYKVYTSA